MKRGVDRKINSEDVFFALSAVNYKSPKVRRLSTVSSVVAAAGHVYSTRWHWYWQDENSKWQSYDTPSEGHAVNTTSSQCLEREYTAGRKSPSSLLQIALSKTSTIRPASVEKCPSYSKWNTKGVKKGRDKF